MNKTRKQLTLKRETLRDLMAQNARDVKAGKKDANKRTKHPTCDCGEGDSYYVCAPTVLCW